MIIFIILPDYGLNRIVVIIPTFLLIKIPYDHTNQLLLFHTIQLIRLTINRVKFLIRSINSLL